MIKLAFIIGTRPQWIKHLILLPVIKQYYNCVSFDTAQHYDDLLLPKERIKYNVTTNTDTIISIENACMQFLNDNKPNYCIVYGDTQSTLDGANAANKIGIRIIHIEAGERCFYETPEEKIRIAVDKMAFINFCVSTTAIQNLHTENLNKNIFLIGDLMKDRVVKYLENEKTQPILYPYILCTLHRKENQNKDQLLKIFTSINKLPQQIILPLHLSTLKLLTITDINSFENIKFVNPIQASEILDYIYFSEAVITDSGGLQREAYWMKKKCFVLRQNTEWIETTLHQWVKVIKNIDDLLFEFNNQEVGLYDNTLYGKGDASEKITNCLKLIL